jgi:hypothetical protein
MIAGFAPAQLKYAAKVTKEVLQCFDSKMIDDKFTLNVYEAMTMISMDLMYYMCNSRGKVGFGFDFEAVKRWADKNDNYDRETLELFANVSSGVLYILIVKRIGLPRWAWFITGDSYQGQRSKRIQALFQKIVSDIKNGNSIDDSKDATNTNILKKLLAEKSVYLHV